MRNKNTLTILDYSIQLTANDQLNNPGFIHPLIGFNIIPGDVYTASCLYKPLSTTIDNPYVIVGLWNDNWIVNTKNFNNTEEVQLLTHTFTMGENISNNIYFSLWNPGSSVEYYGAKLERGPVSTLAYKDNRVWKLNQQQDYLQELLKCKQYLINIKGPKKSNILSVGQAHTTEEANFAIPLTVPFKYKTPVVISDTYNLYCTGIFDIGFKSIQPVSIIRIYSITETVLHVDCVLNNSNMKFIAGNCYSFYSSYTDLLISCEI